MITFKKVKNYQFLGSETVRPRNQYISEQTDNTGAPLYQATWLGIEIGKMEIQFRGEVIGYALTDEEWRNFIQDHARNNEVRVNSNFNFRAIGEW
jgi:hypothetical protein